MSSFAKLHYRRILNAKLQGHNHLKWAESSASPISTNWLAKMKNSWLGRFLVLRPWKLRTCRQRTSFRKLFSWVLGVYQMGRTRNSNCTNWTEIFDFPLALTREWFSLSLFLNFSFRVFFFLRFSMPKGWVRVRCQEFVALHVRYMFRNELCRILPDAVAFYVPGEYSLVNQQKIHHLYCLTEQSCYYWTPMKLGDVVR